MTSVKKLTFLWKWGRRESPTLREFRPFFVGRIGRLVPDRRSLGRFRPVDGAATSLDVPAAFVDHYPLTKRILDVIGAVVLAIVFSPLIFAVALVLSRTGGVLYKHKRVGEGGRVFECLKFRTMIPDAERVLKDILASDDALMAEWVLTHKLRNDPPVTWVGRFLSKTRMDELPQLWKV